MYRKMLAYAGAIAALGCLTAPLLAAGAPAAATPAATAPAAGGPPPVIYTALNPPPGYVPPVGSGPYPAIMEADPGLKTHTLYHPKALETFGGKGPKLAIVAHAEGGCMNVGSGFRNYLTEIASHGFLVLAIGPIGSDMSLMPEFKMPANFKMPKPGQTFKPSDLPPGMPPMSVGSTKASQLTDAINWAIAENSRKGSKFYGKLDTSAVAVMGQSCGGIQALGVSNDPRVKTSVILNSGIFKNGSPLLGVNNIGKAALDKLHAPTIYIIGGPTDIAYENAEDDFGRIKAVPTYIANLDVGHVGTYREKNGGEFGRVATAWLEWQLKGNKEAAKMFVGADCGLCKDKKWNLVKNAKAK